MLKNIPATSDNPRQKSLKHPLPLHSVERTFYCLTGCNNIGKGRGTNTVRECSKCFKVFVEDCRWTAEIQLSRCMDQSQIFIARQLSSRDFEPHVVNVCNCSSVIKVQLNVGSCNLVSK